ncbi:ribonuclease H-like domain-containing protein, partial [Tanacetum coccineum]
MVVTMVMLFRWWWVRLWWPIMVVAAVAAVVRRWRWCGRHSGVVTKQWRWGSGDDGEARAGKVASGGGGGRNNSSEKMEGMEEVRSSDEESTLANNRFTKANEYHAVPPPITGNPLTPRADISFAGLDEYAFRNKIIESKTTETNKTLVIIEDWTSEDEDDVCADKTVSSVKPNVNQAVRSQANKSGQTSQNQGIGFKKVHKIKACFVCKSTGHLIKDCDFYDQKSPEPRVKNVVNTGKRVVKPLWDYGKR